MKQRNVAHLQRIENYCLLRALESPSKRGTDHWCNLMHMIHRLIVRASWQVE